MRIPWYIYTPLSLLVTFLTLYLCVKDKDMVTPPSPEIIAESLEKWRADNPSIRNTKLTPEPPEPEPDLRLIEPKPETIPTPPEPEPPSVPVVKIPDISPALNSLTQQNLNSLQLTSYAEQMLKNRKHQLARIAYERIIDYAEDASEDDRKMAGAAILKLTSKTPLWNPDPSMRKKFTLNLTINAKYTLDPKPLLEQLQKTIFNASDGTMEANIKLTSNTAPLCSLSLGDDSPVRFSISSDDDLDPKIHAALYNAIRNKHNQSQKLTSIPALPTDISPKQALQSYITRLAWAQVAK